MVWIGSMVFLLAACAIAFGVLYSLKKTVDGHPRDGRRGDEIASRFSRAASLGIAIPVFVVLAALVSAFFMVHQVPAGHVGVVYTFGSITGQTSDGLVVTAPWQELRNADVRVQSAQFADLGAASSETQDLFFTVTLNYSVSPNAVQDLYRNVGPRYFDVLVAARINQYFKDETVQYNAIDVTRQRDEIRAAVEQRLTDDLRPYSITVVALLIDDVEYSPEFNASIEQKQVATQEALRAQEVVKQREFEAQQLVAQANGKAEAAVIEARGQADANNLLNASLTDRIIQYEAVRSLSDNVQIALIPSGQGIIIDPATLLSGARTP